MKERHIKEIIMELKKINANLELARQSWFHRNFRNCERCNGLRALIKENTKFKIEGKK